MWEETKIFEAGLARGLADRRLAHPNLNSYLRLLETAILAIDPPLEYLTPFEVSQLAATFGRGENIYALAKRAHSEFMRDRILGVRRAG